MSASSSDDGNDSDYGSELGLDEQLARIHYEADLVIEKNLEYDYDVSIILNLAAKAPHFKNQLAQNYWFFICSRIGADITTNESNDSNGYI